MDIAESSPLFKYWNSEQNQNDEEKRLLMLIENEIASNLFRYEPYKWENLYQSAVTNIVKGDESSIKGLMVLLSAICERDKDKSLKLLEKIVNSHVIYKLRHQNYHDIKFSTNLFTAFKILIVIFTNPYGLDIKKNRNHIYERTGMFFYQVRKRFTSKYNFIF